jgi:cell division protein FtsZ
MDLDFNLPKDKSSIIKVIGVGGGGTNAVNHMYHKGIAGVNFIVCNTDEQHLFASPVPNKILLGPELTNGLGVGADPVIGRKATEESLAQIKEELGHNTQMLFITAGMGKGTGTGGSPVVAQVAREMGILTIAIVTTPFSNLGKSAVEKATAGIESLKEEVDAIIIISNDKIREMYGSLKGSEAFALANDVLATAAKGISEIITVPGEFNTDFADVKGVLTSGGVTIMGSGYADGADRAKITVKKALESPLLNDGDIRGAKKALVNVSSSREYEVTIDEIDEILNDIRLASRNDIDIIFGSTYDDTLGEELGVTIVVTGFNGEGFEELEEVAVQKEIINVMESNISVPMHEDNKIYVDAEQEVQIELELELNEINTYEEDEEEQEQEQGFHDFNFDEREEAISLPVIEIKDNGSSMENASRSRILNELSLDFSKPFEFDEEEDDFNLGSLVDKSKKTISDSNINIIGENKMTEKNVC